MTPFRFPPNSGYDPLLRSYLRALVSELNDVLSRLREKQEKLSSEALLPVGISSLSSLPAGVETEDDTAFAVRMGKNVLLTAGDRLFLGFPDGDGIRWTEK